MRTGTAILVSAAFVSSVIALAAATQNPPTGHPPSPAPPATQKPAPLGPLAADVNLMTNEGTAIFTGQWRYSDVKIIETPFTAPAPAGSGATGPANTTYDISPRAGEATFDDSSWTVIAATSLGERRAGGKVCFAWYRINLTMPAKFAELDLAGMTAVLNCTVDDYAEVWVNGQLPRALNQDNPNLITGWNKPNRVVLSNNVKPGEKIQVAIFGINGPISAAPTNYIWFREAKIEFYAKP